MSSSTRDFNLLSPVNTQGPQKSPSGVPKACTLKRRQALFLHPEPSSATSFASPSPSESVFQAARELRPQAFGMLNSSNLLHLAIIAPTQGPLRPERRNPGLFN